MCNCVFSELMVGQWKNLVKIYLNFSVSKFKFVATISICFISWELESQLYLFLILTTREYVSRVSCLRFFDLLYVVQK